MDNREKILKNARLSGVDEGAEYAKSQELLKNFRFLSWSIAALVALAYLLDYPGSKELSLVFCLSQSLDFRTSYRWNKGKWRFVVFLYFSLMTLIILLLLLRDIFQTLSN